MTKIFFKEDSCAKFTEGICGLSQSLQKISVVQVNFPVLVVNLYCCTLSTIRNNRYSIANKTMYINSYKPWPCDSIHSLQVSFSLLHCCDTEHNYYYYMSNVQVSFMHLPLLSFQQRSTIIHSYMLQFNCKILFSRSHFKPMSRHIFNSVWSLDTELHISTLAAILRFVTLTTTPRQQDLKPTLTTAYR